MEPFNTAKYTNNKSSKKSNTIFYLPVSVNWGFGCTVKLSKEEKIEVIKTPIIKCVQDATHFEESCILVTHLQISN